jgi:hypothetical protein
MSLNDGRMHGENLYITTDIALAAYLLLRGYELLGAIDTGTRRKEFGLTNTDPNILSNMYADIQSKADEFENMHLDIPHDMPKKVSFKIYYSEMKNLHHSLDEPIKLPKE